MTTAELRLVHEALRSAHRELEALAEEDIYLTSGRLIEQLESAIKITEVPNNAG